MAETIIACNELILGVVKPEPGRDDAFARLVDAAVSAPSLPVPKEEPRNRVSLPRGNFHLFYFTTLNRQILKKCNLIRL